MELIFLGVGNAFTTADYYQCNMALKQDNNLLLIDCGSDVRFSLQEQFPHIHNGNLHKYIKGVYVSHIHQDHVGGLEWIGFCTYFNPEAKPIHLVMDRSLKQPLWDECLKGAMQKVANDDAKNIEDYFRCGLIDSDKNGAFKFGSAMLQPIQLIHVPSHEPKYSYGLFIKNGDHSCYITTDSVFDYEASKSFYNDADMIFQDCETTPYRSNVHAHYDDLKQLPPEIKKRMWLCHYMPDAHEKYNPTNDGFLGFVDKGQTFVI